MDEDETEIRNKAAEQALSRERIIISVLLTIASILLAIVHLLVPRLQVDAVIIALLVVAVLPWLGSIFQSIEWGGWKLQYRQLRREVDEIKGARASTEHDVNLALATAQRAAAGGREQLDGAKSADQRVKELAGEYNEIRREPAGADRTLKMTRVVEEVIQLAPKLKDFDSDRALFSEDRGMRLVAYAYLFARPDPRHLERLVESVTRREDKPFGQYWGLRAIRRMIESIGSQQVPRELVTELEAFGKTRLRPGQDRYYELSQILRHFNVKIE